VRDINSSNQFKIASTQFLKEKKYWIKKLSGEFERTTFNYDNPGNLENNNIKASITFDLPQDICIRMFKLGGGSDAKLHMILVACTAALLAIYTGHEEIILGTTIDRQDTDEPMINTILPLRISLLPGTTFKELLLMAKKTVNEAIENQNYPMEELISHLKINSVGNGFPLFDVAILLENLQDRKYLRQINTGICFFFNRHREKIVGEVEYPRSHYHQKSIEQIISQYILLLQNTIFDVDQKIENINLVDEKNEQLLIEFNKTTKEFPFSQTAQGLFEIQSEKTPDQIAAVEIGNRHSLSYIELNRKADLLAAKLSDKGVKNGAITAISVDHSLELIIGILGILKTGSAYLPIAPDYPVERTNYMMADSRAETLVTGKQIKDWTSSSATVRALKLGNSFDIVYIIYTSGSTGKPKGVMIEQHSLVNYIWWAVDQYVKKEEIHFPLFSSISFDLTATSIFTPLVTGNMLLIYKNQDIWDVIDNIIDDNYADVIKLTPSHLQLIREKKMPGRASHIKRLILGGEPLPTSTTKAVQNNFTEEIEIYNEYGPTEATVGCMIYRYNKEIDTNPFVPIGKPAGNCLIYLLNKNKNPVPPGAVGEIFIGGQGVARGYLNQPELTAEKYVHISPKFLSPIRQKLYRTGDMARWLPNWNLDFLGRSDQQVKIKGYRIELGEIETLLLQHKEVKEAVVSVLPDNNEIQQLCAYIVPVEGASFSLNHSVSEELKQFLGQKLVDYMIPTFFEIIEKIPLTINGKVNRNALAPPQWEPLTQYRAPGNEQEIALVEVWQQVFRNNEIGTRHNFFDLGGDSIKAVQISARLNKKGYGLEIRNLFQYPKISELAAFIKKVERIADQRVITGTVPLSPIQEWFFSKHFNHPHHFNQAIMISFNQQNKIDEKAIESIFLKLQEHHDALRMTYSLSEGKFLQINHGLDYPLSLKKYDCRHRSDAVEFLEHQANCIQNSIDLEKGPLMKLGLFHMDDGYRLLIVIHHLVIDTVSWRILLEDIDTLYRQYTDNETLKLPLKTDSFKLWSEKLLEYANSPLPLKELKYWREIESLTIQKIPADIQDGTNYIKDSKIISFTLGKRETELLLTRVNQAFGTDINDILLTALGLGFTSVFGLDKLLISMESHGRGQLLSDLNIHRTVGWFTAIYPVLLDFSFQSDLSRQIIEVKETLRNIPNSGTGYCILKYLTKYEYKKDLSFQVEPQIQFNYLGQFDTDIERQWYSIAKESPGYPQQMDEKRGHSFDITGSISDGKLEISILYSLKQYKPETIEQLTSSYKAILDEIISFCAEKNTRVFTPSDFTFKKIPVETLTWLQSKYSIKDIYPLTPMQEGMLFHTLYDDSSAVYCAQSSFRHNWNWDISRIKKSLTLLVERYDILRTVFVVDRVDRPLQLVLSKGEIDILFEDLRKKFGENQSEIDQYINHIKRERKNQPFDLQKGPLMRLNVFQIDNSLFEFIWGFHHILMDGWCIGILLSEFFEIYKHFSQGKPYQLPNVIPYRNYILWLENQDKEKSKKYWQQYLEGYNTLASLPGKKLIKSSSEFKNQHIDFSLDINKTEALKKLAAKHLVTVNTIIQSLWGVVLSKYSGKNDVVFGFVVSGRPPEIQGVESIVGLFINTVPVRIKYQEEETFDIFLRRSQESVLAGEPHHYYPLAEIQAEHPLKQDLLDHIIVFENFPVMEDLNDKGLVESESENSNKTWDDTESEDSVYTNYHFYISILPQESILIRLKYNENVYDSELINKIGLHFCRAVEQVISYDTIRLDQLRLFQEDKKKKILAQFMDNLEDE